LGKNTFEYVKNALENFTIYEYININDTNRAHGHVTRAVQRSPLSPNCHAA